MGCTTQVSPISPTACLPPLSRLHSYSLDHITEALANLQIIYLPTRSLHQTISLKRKQLPNHPIHDTSVPDSGYASEEEDDDDDTDHGEDVDILRADSMERDFAIRWLTKFTAQSEDWMYLVEEEENARTMLVDDAAAILSSFSRDEEEPDLTRKFKFSVGRAGKIHMEVELNDASLLSADHTSVGLQSWASSILLSERMCLDPDTWGFMTEGARVLELGAGTGLLSIVAAKLMQPSEPHHIIATDYHPSVLTNLQHNVRTNFPSTSSFSPVDVFKLDWEHPEYDAPLDKPFDVILAADVVYEPEHARWIKSCVKRLLARPSATLQKGGVFWMIIALRPSGRHEGLADTVTEVFPLASKILSSEPGLAILQLSEIGRQSGVGRADESAYLLFKIGWVQTSM
ncbi:hypothetical protein EUX98_g3567 [Antrodiella citrinella]|uniref:Methyltransferase domain-containing protein n=1 Tax=Antrodiella citrinella TaxID=2447956 RepID=A0A4S4N4F2_9APHY|nr:hypothetical protein EUX98_g3567 [Antrodiella citrinella]